MFRLIIFFLLAYLAFHVVRLLFAGRQQSPSRVSGKRTNPPLDLSGLDVEDAKFEELKKR